jgi:hypothetical protein
MYLEEEQLMASPTKKKKAIRKVKATPNKVNLKAELKRQKETHEILVRLSQAQ